MKNTVDFKKLKTKNLLEEDINFIETTTLEYMNAYKHCIETLDDIEAYFVFLYTGGCKVFSTRNGYVLVDKLDKSYTTSRELVCMSTWNIRKAIRLSFTEEKAKFTVVSFSDLQKVLFTLITPRSITYLVYSIEDNEVVNPQPITVDLGELGSLGYKEYYECITDTYKHLQGRGSSLFSLSDLRFIITSYSLEE